MKVTVVYCTDIHHWYICITMVCKSVHAKKRQYSPDAVPTKLGYTEGTEISDCFIVVNGPLN